MDSTRRSFVASLSYVGALAALGSQDASGAENPAAHLDARADLLPLIEIERKTILATMAAQNISGAAVCLVHEGAPIWMEGFGVTDKRSNRPIGFDTIFSIQSTSKNMTATAIMLAVQRGWLDLDKPITTYLRDFTVNSRFEARPQDKITLRHLLNHTAGFTHDAPVGNNNDPTFASFEAHVASISETWLRFPVGERIRYSNLGVDVAGYILQIVMKRPFAECLTELLFDDLGMKDTTADTDTYVRRENRAVGHEQGYDAVPLRLPFIPSGGVYASIRDMAKYAQFHIDQGRIGHREILRSTQWNEMHSFALPGAFALGVAGGKIRYGNTDVQMLMHNGGGVGFGSTFRFYPQAKLGWIALFNSASGAAFGWGAALTDQILERRFGKKTARIKSEDFKAAELEIHDLHKFVGSWNGRTGGATFDLKQGTLVLRRGDRDIEVKIVSPVDIVLPAEGPGRDATQLRYVAGRNGAMPHLVSLLGDGHMDYNDGPNDLPGPDRKEWNRFIGDYRTERWGKTEYKISIHRKNGYLYGNEFRFVAEFRPGIFATSNGETVDFTRAIPTWRSVPLFRN